jgi:transcriptional regulator with XRE-family HTH domain
MINAEQIRAARAFLDWSTADLAKQTGLTANGINKIERGRVAPQEETLRRIEKAFDNAGLAFLPFSGIKRKEQIIEVWTGEEAGARLFEDIYATMRDEGGEVLVSGVDESRSTGHVGHAYVKKHIEKLLACGVHEKLLAREGDMTFVGPLASYHWIPARYHAKDSLAVYGPKIALVTWERPEKVVIVNDPRMAESVRRLFAFAWDHTKGPAGTKSGKRAP